MHAAGYKGYGLAMMVEVMCGMLGGSTYAHHIRKWTGEEHRKADLVPHTLYTPQGLAVTGTITL